MTEQQKRHAFSSVQSVVKDYQSYTLSTTVARVNKEVNMSGNTVLILSSPVNVGIRLHNVNNENIDYQQYDSVIAVTGFNKFYISHAAIAGGSIKLVIFTNKNLGINIVGRSSSGGRASVINVRSLAMAVAGTEYTIALNDNIKRLKLINTDVAAIMRVSPLALDSANGIPLLPSKTHNIENIDLESYSLYAQSDIAVKTLYLWEFL